MIGKQDVSKAFGGLTFETSPEMMTALELWASMYEENAPWLGREDMATMNLPVTIAGEISRVATIEMEVSVTGSTRADYLQERLKATVLKNMRETIEIGCAKGGLVLKPYISDDKIVVDVIHADHFFPISFDSDGNIVAAIFVDQIKKGERFYTSLVYHNYT